MRHLQGENIEPSLCIFIFTFKKKFHLEAGHLLGENIKPSLSFLLWSRRNTQPVRFSLDLEFTEFSLGFSLDEGPREHVLYVREHILFVREHILYRH